MNADIHVSVAESFTSLTEPTWAANMLAAGVHVGKWLVCLTVFRSRCTPRTPLSASGSYCAR